MRFSNEAKVGIIGIATALVLFWGINYLKGKNILNRSYTLVALFDSSGGLESSSPVILKGVKVGLVDRIDLLPAEPKPVRVYLSIEREFLLGQGSSATLISADLLGTKAIEISPASSGIPLRHMDTIPTSVQEDLLSRLQQEIVPVFDQVGGLVSSLDSLAAGLNSLIGDSGLSESLGHIQSLSGSLDAAMKNGGVLHSSLKHLENFSGSLSSRSDTLVAALDHLKGVTGQLESANLDSLAGSLLEASAQLSGLLAQLNSGTGSAGKLIYSDSLYADIRSLVTGLDSLVRDLKENPEDYVRISVFGRSD